jgi:hypothetical protein
MSIASIEQALRKDLPHHWLETEAEVTDCEYTRISYTVSGAGIDDDLAHYAVGFTYNVNGTTYTGELSSPVQVERGDKFLLHYNPTDPKENNSLESELDRPWFKDYTYVFGALVLGLMLYGLIHQYLHH